jgi:hypothetical protein
MNGLLRDVLEAHGGLSRWRRFNTFGARIATRYVDGMVQGLMKVLEELSAFTWDDSEQGRSATGTAIRTGVPGLA